MAGYQCDTCKKWITNAYEGYDVRRDYRTLNGKARPRSWHLSFVCRRCAEAEWEHHDNPSGAQQGGLFA
jgi:hypothetical protein